ncbi:phosphodiester glycosidase family protein [Arenibacter sp. M-2]|uniref:phosphodiester glycosidase family protein n=1 Tax=Arenibacter sp. M-2 TaxID=3053612 RepID=UPI002571072F|nr:phosphodiester glycosidase family protein [Arenibacter sp. M-2]MDL5514940.1 phosphodiester glycosidase family protein [Arenibacter sp. M-2]
MKNLKYIILTFVCIQFVACSNDDYMYTNYEGGATTEIGQLVQNNTNLVAMVKSDSTYSIVEGMQTTEINYINSEGYSIKAFISTVDLTTPGINIEVSTPSNSPAYGRQKMTEQAAYEDKEGHLVWAGFNGDFFDATTGIPRGIVYKDGVAIKGTFVDPTFNWFAIKKDGTASVGYQEEYALQNKDFKEAVGGRVILLNDGIILPQTDKRLEPRSAVGVSKDGNTVYFLVVDGRNFTYSNGIDYASMAQIFSAIGAYDAMNIDGGGSSTFFTRTTPDFTEDRFQLRNWPSDNGGQERSVANGIVIISE